MASNLLKRVCSSDGDSIHLAFDKYISPSIKDCERKLRRSHTAAALLHGCNKSQSQTGTKCLKNRAFKDRFSRFVMDERKNKIDGSTIQNETVLVYNGGKCFEYKVNSHNNILETTEPVSPQGQHEEADTLIAFYVKAITGNVLVRSTGTDVLVILLGLGGRKVRRN